MNKMRINNVCGCKKDNKRLIIGGIAALALVAAPVAAVSGSAEADSPQPSFTLAVQCGTVARYDSNAFIVRSNYAGAVTVDYMLSSGGEYETIKTTSARSMAYRCREEGVYSVKAKVTAGGESFTTAAVSFTVVGDGGEMFGYSPSGEAPTHGVDLSRDNGDEPLIEHMALGKISDEYAYVKSINSAKFAFGTSIDIVGNNYNDQYPKAGIFVKSGKTTYLIAFDARVDGNNNTLVVVRNNGSGWEWSSGSTYSVRAPFRDGDDRIAHSLTVVRDGADMFIAVDEIYIAKKTVSGFTAPAVVGTYTMAQNAIFSRYYTLEGEALDAEIEAARESLK